jgi:folylpolyglutamate synthase/dihydropteroate synthase
LLDGAHNPAAAVLLRRHIDLLLSTMFEAKEANVSWIIGISAEKDLAGVLDILLRPGDHVFAVPFSQPIAMTWIQCRPPSDIAKMATRPGVSDEAMPDLPSAFARAYNCQCALTVVCGSLYLAADVYRLLGRDVEDFS